MILSEIISAVGLPRPSRIATRFRTGLSYQMFRLRPHIQVGSRWAGVLFRILGTETFARQWF